MKQLVRRYKRCFRFKYVSDLYYAPVSVDLGKRSKYNV
jgi:hypothetical protein